MAVRIDPSWLSAARFAEYLAAVEKDSSEANRLDHASRLYEWNAEVSAALFEVIHHFEVLLRNSIIEQLAQAGQAPNALPGSPWIEGHAAIETAKQRLIGRKKSVTANHIYAGLSYGFWQRMFGNDYEEVWRHSLRHVFPNSRVDRSIVAASLDSIGILRNRVAHHGSLIDFATEVEVAKIIRVTQWMNKDAADWIKSIERVTSITARRPVTPRRNVVVVPAGEAWEFYETKKQNAYIFPVGRTIKAVDRLAFYENQEIKRYIPKILRHEIAVDWNSANAKRLSKSSDALDQVLGQVIMAGRANGWTANAYQVFLLSGPKDNETETLKHAIKHSRRGRGSAFARHHRYQTLGELKSAKDTSDLG